MDAEFLILAASSQWSPALLRPRACAVGGFHPCRPARHNKRPPSNPRSQGTPGKGRTWNVTHAPAIEGSLHLRSCGAEATLRHSGFASRRRSAEPPFVFPVAVAVGRFAQ